MPLGDPVRIVQEIAKVFDHLGIPYFVGGSLASSLHGIPRATQDVDIVAEIEEEHILPLVEELQSEFYVDADMIKDAVSRQACFNVIHLDTMFKADIFILKPDEPSRNEMARRRRYQIVENTPQGLFLASPEDVIVHKLYWYQKGGELSERQWNDVLGILKVQSASLDYSYLKKAAEKREVADLLQSAFEEAKLD